MRKHNERPLGSPYSLGGETGGMQLNDTAATCAAHRKTGTSHCISDITTPGGGNLSGAEELTVYVAKNVFCDCCHSQRGGTQRELLRYLLSTALCCNKGFSSTNLSLKMLPELEHLLCRQPLTSAWDELLV